jgi:hypothetical protein
VLRRILGPKRVEILGSWRKLHNEEPNVKENELGKASSSHGEKDAYRILVRKPEGRLGKQYVSGRTKLKWILEK